MLHSPRWETWDWILIELVSKAARSYEASRVGRKALQTQLTESWYSASSWKCVKARQAPHPQQWLWVLHVLGDAAGPITLEKVQGFFPRMRCCDMNMMLFCLGTGSWYHHTALSCACSTWPLERYLHCVPPVNQQIPLGNITEQLGTKQGHFPLFWRSCAMDQSGFFEPKLRRKPEWTT